MAKEKDLKGVVMVDWKKLLPILAGLIVGIILVSVLFYYFV